MQNITFLRTSLDKLFNNAFVKTIASLVNFCKEQGHFGKKELKFSQNLPLNNIVKQKTLISNYNTRYVFTNLNKQDNK